MYKCKICNSVFDKQTKLAAHSNIHNYVESSCKICGKTFDSAAKLKGHLSSHSRKVKEKVNKINNYICSFCNKEFENGLKLGGHKTNCKLNPTRELRIEKLREIRIGSFLSDETKLKISNSRKKYLDENPGQIPYLLNHSSKESYPEKIFREKLILDGIVGWTQEYPFLRYSLDFGFINHKVDVEIDGGTHKLDNIIKKDIERDKVLTENGWVVFRITDYEVKNKLGEKIYELKNLLNNR